ncbi:3-deoxy-manno-octulosonate cytidylyltransferase [Solitalea koreensis]|uniref:3-deoxy-manno-octulosonate cytidylyltransferase n=1 Tax=Solitalea koreensis TaxID=543615 RepID=A0A521C985_9SPHI|nr:3-deoxy-manno-octulosonate cytidylyltransferase [Solitalea koreensis]SMO55924.1 3-deoxy-manno-octulosonate cytidylyltransferase (CMP-KDO synthetase) [Solitalea koreensis]
MKKAALIPARYKATRFPGKLMADLEGKTVILRTYEAAVATQLFDIVAVVTDSQLIFDEIVTNGGKAIMSKKEHECGSDRIAEAVLDMDVDIVVNVQGDEPFTEREPLEKLLAAFNGEDGKKTQVASLMHEITDWDSIQNSNNVKVAVDLNSYALLFSRSPIPYPRNKEAKTRFYKHIGIYAFRKDALLRITKLPVSPLENAESIECLRYLENGIPMKMIVTDFATVGIDTPEDLTKAKEVINKSIKL